MFTRDKDDASNTQNAINLHNTISIGAQAEAQAETFLQQQGLVTRCKNYRCKLGEIGRAHV